MAGKRFLALDGLRGVCALGVLLFHSNDLFHQGPIFQHGYLAVDMFFLLSGFVIAHAHEQHLTAGRGLAWFLRIRARRLLPVFYVGAVFNVAVFIAMASAGYYPPDFSQAAIWVIVPLTTFLMLPAFAMPGIGFSPAMMNVTWSLAVEWLINIAYAAIAFRCRTRTLALCVVGGWAAMAVAGYFTQTGWCVGMSRNDFLSLGLLRGMPSFLAGVVLFRLYTRGWFARLPVLAPELVMTFWLGIAVIPTVTATPTLDWIAVTLIFPVLLVLLLRGDDRAPAFCKTLGEISYPLYVIHPGIILLARGTPLFGFDRGPNPLRALAVAGFCVCAAWAVAALSRWRPGPWQPGKVAA